MNTNTPQTPSVTLTGAVSWFYNRTAGVLEHKVVIMLTENIIFVFGILLIISMTVTDIYEAMNSKAETFFEWLQAHPQYGLLFGVGLLALWLAGLLFRWKWACHWQFNSKLWLFDDCKPETRRRVQIVLVSVLIILILVGFFVWR